MRPALLRLPSFVAVVALLGFACGTLPACGDSADPPLTKKGAGGKGGSGTGGTGGTAGTGGKPARMFEVAGACTDVRMVVEIDKKSYPIDCDVWRGPNAAYRVFEALDKCCTEADRKNEAYDTFTPQGKLVYQLVAALHQAAIDNDLLTVDLEGTVRCETAVNAALPQIAMCKGGVDITAVLAACDNFVFGKIQEGASCPDTDTCVQPASCLGADGKTTEKGVCKPPGTQGVPCANENEAPRNGTKAHPLCAPGLVCAKGRCQTQSPDGTDCIYDLSCASGRCAAQKCAPALSQKAALGAACQGASDCVDKLRCVGGVCEDKLEGGAACTPMADECRVFCENNGKCAGLFCGIDRL